MLKNIPDKILRESPNQLLEDQLEEEELKEFQPLFMMTPELYLNHSWNLLLKIQSPTLNMLEEKLSLPQMLFMLLRDKEELSMDLACDS